MEQLIALVGEFGLAVSLTIAFMFMFWKILNMQREDSREREQRDRDTIERFSQILSTNSSALLKNSEVMDKINGNIETIHEDIKHIQEDVTEIKFKQANKDNK